MTHEGTDWDRIRSLFEQAIDLTDDERNTFLERTCGDNPELLREVESLIEADREAPAFLDGPGFMVRASTPPAGPLEGTRIGPWRILHEIGRGGMSVVYLGERADGGFERRVAIKVLQSDARLARLGGRLRTERRILGWLDHRGIVRILDGGVLQDGRPYLVMDYIEGERIDVWCDRHRLPIRERLRLFIQVLDAVTSAHRALIVHRDLKPDNILVTEAGEVRLLDFGIAKLLEPDDEETGTPTRLGLRAMTPEYAAPEQIRGDPITTACDIYALGVLLFHLLAGRRPYPGGATSLRELEQAVLETEPDPPSRVIRKPDPSDPDVDEATTIAAARRTDPTRLSGLLEGDLDAIVLKALRKEPGERYASVDAFRGDIERFLSSLPVLARRGSRAYHVRKFVRRHRVGVAVTVAAVLLALTTTVTIAMSRSVARRALAQAEREARTAREVTDFVIGVFGGSNPWNARRDTVSARTILEEGRERIARELVDVPTARASLLHGIGQAYTRLGLLGTADTLIAEAIRLRGVAPLSDGDAELVRMYHSLGRVKLEQDHYDNAIANLERALALNDALASPDTATRADALLNLAFAYAETGQPDTALALAAGAMALDSIRADTSSARHLQRLLNYAMVLRAAERLETASELYARALPRMARHPGVEDPSYSMALNNAAFLLTRQERWADAVTLYRQAIEVARRSLGADHGYVLTGLGNLASALINSGQPDEGLRTLEEIVALQQSRWGEGSWQLGSARKGLGKAFIVTGDAVAAERAFRAAVASFHASLGVDHIWSGVAETWVILAMTMRGDERAEDLLERAIARLTGAGFDASTTFDVRLIAGHLDALGRSDYAARFRTLVRDMP